MKKTDTVVASEETKALIGIINHRLMDVLEDNDLSNISTADIEGFMAAIHFAEEQMWGVHYENPAPPWDINEISLSLERIKYLLAVVSGRLGTCFKHGDIEKFTVKEIRDIVSTLLFAQKKLSETQENLNIIDAK